MKKWGLLFALLLAVLTACSSGGSNDANQNSFETIDISDVESYVEKGYVVVDVREIDEYASGHITDAINLPLSTLESEMETTLSKDQQYVIICRSGNRSQTASTILNAAGYDIVNVNAGMSSWTGEVVTN